MQTTLGVLIARSRISPFWGSMACPSDMINLSPRGCSSLCLAENSPAASAPNPCLLVWAASALRKRLALARW